MSGVISIGRMSMTPNIVILLLGRLRCCLKGAFVDF